MRKVELAMIRAIERRQDWHKGNTSVEWDGSTCRIWLHGNKIAQFSYGLWSFTLAGWNTPTTRSRLHALMGAFDPAKRHVFCRDFTPYLHDPATGKAGEIGTYDWF